MTHEELRKLAVRWLSSTKRCSVVLSEMVSAAMENPDAIGWKFGFSCLVECKVSRSDFLANKNKWCIKNGRMMGCERYFLCPVGIIKVEDVDDEWGLLWVRDSGNIQIVKKAQNRNAYREDEVKMLVSALRRVRTKEFLTINMFDEQT